MNDMADDTWDNKAVNRISAIHFLDDGEDDDDEKVRVTGSTSPVAFLLDWITAVEFFQQESVPPTSASGAAKNTTETRNNCSTFLGYVHNNI